MEEISNTLASLRQEYGNRELDKGNLKKNPIEQFKDWLDDAIKIEANEPNAMAISTVSKENKPRSRYVRSEEHTPELQSRSDLVCRLLLEKKKKKKKKKNK